jgi:positive phototaxis protein PixI
MHPRTTHTGTSDHSTTNLEAEIKLETLPAKPYQHFFSFVLPPDLPVMIPNDCVAEILMLTSENIMGIPEVPPEIMGIAPWRGEVLWLLDLSYMMGKTPLFRQGYRNTPYSVIVISRNNQTLGLVVDRVEQMLRCAEENILPAEAVETAVVPPFTQACWSPQSAQRTWILDCNLLLDHLSNQTTSAQTPTQTLTASPA